MTFEQLDGESLKLSRGSGMGRVTVLREVIRLCARIIRSCTRR